MFVVVVDCTRKRKSETMSVKTAVNCQGLLERIGATPADSLTELMGDSDGGTPSRMVLAPRSVRYTLPPIPTVMPAGLSNRAPLPTPLLEPDGYSPTAPATVLTTPAADTYLIV